MVEYIQQIQTTPPGSTNGLTNLPTPPFVLTGSNGVYQATGFTIALPAAGTYLIYFTARYSLSFSVGTVAIMTARLFDNTASVVVPNSHTLLTEATVINQSYIGSSSRCVLYTVTGPTTIEMQVVRDLGTTYTASEVDSSGDGLTNMGFIKVA